MTVLLAEPPNDPLDELRRDVAETRAHVFGLAEILSLERLLAP